MTINSIPLNSKCIAPGSYLFSHLSLTNYLLILTTPEGLFSWPAYGTHLLTKTPDITYDLLGGRSLTLTPNLDSLHRLLVGNQPGFREMNICVSFWLTEMWVSVWNRPLFGRQGSSLHIRQEFMLCLWVLKRKTLLAFVLRTGQINILRTWGTE